MTYITVYNFSFNSNCRILAAELNCTLPKYKFICALYLGKTNFEYQFRGLTTLGCLAAIYILNMYLKRINKKYISVSTCFGIYDTMFLIIGVGSRVGSRSRESDLKKVPGVRVGVVVFQNARSRSQSRSRIF